MITKPLLSPIEGYVETEYNREHVYKSVATGRIFKTIPMYNPNELEQKIADLELKIILLKK